MQKLSSKKWKCGKQKRIGENMYLHIGKDEMIKKEHILWLLDYKGLQNNKTFQEFFDSIPKENKINISQNQPKTVIITRENKSIKAYISNISSNTLANRKFLEIKK